MANAAMSSWMKDLLKSTSRFPKARYRSYTTRMAAATSGRNPDSRCKNGRTYEDAVRTLNNLQSNADVVKIATANRDALTPDSLPGTRRYLLRSGVTMEELDTLKIIHVAGTKGKGSTCAFIESILRHAGLKTGFYSSPHLISVRERIRLNGKPLLPEQFAHYFFKIFDQMDKVKEHPTDLPFYFRLLTIMAFNVFLHENVDVAVIEVGIGGLYDSTNIIRNPVVTGITSLGLDHQSILGDTVEEIALQKAGIMKAGVPTITVANNQPEVLRVLEDYATTVKCPLVKAPPIGLYPDNEKIDLGIKDPRVSKINAALAIHAVNAFLARKFPEKLAADNCNNKLTLEFELGKPFTLQSWHLEGLRNCSWPGRFQRVQRNQSLWFNLDGAHTVESFSASLQWYSEVTEKNSVRVLVFHLTGFRTAEKLLEPFILADTFDKVVFCPVVASVNASSSADNWSKVESESDLRARCQTHADAWKSLQHQLNISDRRTEIHICDSVEQVIQLSESISKTNTVEVLVTGSLHLVGTFLSILDPTVCDR